MKIIMIVTMMIRWRRDLLLVGWLVDWLASVY